MTIRGTEGKYAEPGMFWTAAPASVLPVGEILRAVPEANIVLVRTRGLWGSMTSCAPTGSKPNFMRSLRIGGGLLLANLLLFMPRRRVDITVERIDRSQLP